MQIGMHLKTTTVRHTHTHTHTDTKCANPHTPADTHDSEQQQQQQTQQRIEIALKLLALLIRSVCQSRNLLDRLTDWQTDTLRHHSRGHTHPSLHLHPHFHILPLQRISHNNKNNNRFASRQGKRRRGWGKAERLMAKAKQSRASNNKKAEKSSLLSESERFGRVACLPLFNSCSCFLWHIFQ